MSSINFNNALGIHANALQVRAKRAEVLANNLANSDTPGFKARDINFQAILAGESSSKNSVGVSRTHSGHLAGRQGQGEAELLYRNPTQPSIDGNTVDAQIEQAIYTKNSMDYNATFEFLNSKITGVRNALRGE
ncbi:MAG: flagellar basal body rod protein FlgB [Bacterioplanes sp.]|nr:flagellar basal body rod protein FlgB [Bacterioplanes sp.]